MPIGRLVGFKFDAACASTERGHYAMTCKEGSEPVPARWVSGKLLNLADPVIAGQLASLKGPRRNSNKKPDRATRSATASRTNFESTRAADDWRGFKAADAAANLLPSVTDKRGDENAPLVAFPCPFVHEHATSNDPTAHQCYAYNASSVDKMPTVKCQSDTCRDRPFAEFLERSSTQT